MEASIGVVSCPDPPSSEYPLGLSCESNELRMTNTSSIPDEHSPETLLILSHAYSPTLSQSNLLSAVASRVPSLLSVSLMSKFWEFNFLAAILSDVLLSFPSDNPETLPCPLFFQQLPLPHLVLCHQAELGNRSCDHLVRQQQEMPPSEHHPFFASPRRRLR